MNYFWCSKLGQKQWLDHDQFEFSTLFPVLANISQQDTFNLEASMFTQYIGIQVGSNIYGDLKVVSRKYHTLTT